MIDSPVDPYAAILLAVFAIWQVYLMVAAIAIAVRAQGHLTVGVGPGLVAVLLAILIVAT